MGPIVVIIVTWTLILIGLLGTLLPGLPGVVFVFGGILLYALYFGVATIGLKTLLVLGVMTAGTFVLDFFAGMYGAKRFGASRVGIIGSVLGGLGGLMIFNIPGLFLGTFFGAMVGEYMFEKKSLREGAWSGLGSVLGFLAGSVVKCILAFIMVVVFVTRIWI